MEAVVSRSQHCVYLICLRAALRIAHMLAVDLRLPSPADENHAVHHMHCDVHACREAGQVPGGCYLVDLQGCGSRAEVMDRFAAALDLPAGALSAPPLASAPAAATHDASGTQFSSAGTGTGAAAGAGAGAWAAAWAGAGAGATVGAEEAGLADLIRRLAERGRCLLLLDNADSLSPPQGAAGGSASNSLGSGSGRRVGYRGVGGRSGVGGRDGGQAGAAAGSVSGGWGGWGGGESGAAAAAAAWREELLRAVEGIIEALLRALEPSGSRWVPG